ncbi:hypothetical protein [Aneurinibacillus terranovensis]|uniref:hypothetical protein n=1 Tax=Aneurinibacillus terranovensis TaxID=278991 RepID=UPI0003FB16E1|nr:hypothetical protein [Aneurinibacillus terranovensis]
MITFRTILSLALISTAALTGCGLTNNAASNTSTTTTSTTTTSTTAQSDTAKTPSNGQTEAPNVKDGVGKFLHNAKQLRKAIKAGDETKIKEIGPKLEENWKFFEDGVKSQYPDQYAEVEKYLDPTVAGSKASAIDKNTLLKLDNQLIDVLYSLSEKLIPVEQVQDGVSTMLAATKELKQKINTGDQAKVKEIGPKLEEAWSTFEDGLQPRQPDFYEKIEKYLNPEVAGSQVSPLDKQTLGQLNDQLSQTLSELQQKLK